MKEGGSKGVRECVREGWRNLSPCTCMVSSIGLHVHSAKRLPPHYGMCYGLKNTETTQSTVGVWKPTHSPLLSLSLSLSLGLC